MKRLIPALLLVAAGAAMVYAQDDELLDPNRAFAFSATVAAPDRIQITWDIAENYYMYRDKFRVRVVDGDARLGKLQIPPGKQKRDEFFGDVEIYEGAGAVQIQVPVERRGSAAALVIEAEGQGCNEPVGVCYPPVKHTANLMLAAATSTPTATPSSPVSGNPVTSLKSLRDLLGGGGGGQDEFLDPDQAFQMDLSVQDSNTLMARFTIADGYYLYQDKVKFQSQSSGIQIGNYQLPPGKEKQDEYFGKVVAYYQGFDVRVPLQRAESNALSASFDVTYQGCAEQGICYPPITKTVQLDLPGVTAALAAPSTSSQTPTSTSSRLTTGTDNKGFWGYILTAFLTGIALTFTPCVLPMIPILSSIIVGQGDNITKTKGGMLAIAYVLGTAVTYTAGGILAGASGDQLQAYFQNIWAIGAVSGILAVLALSMFGLYEIQMPSFIQSRLQSGTQGMQGRGLGVVFLLGVMSALIVGACVSPLLIVALGVAIMKGDPLLGGAIMFAIALGMGVFLIALGFGAGFLLPKAGAWMDRVKYAFGVLLLGVAIYLLGTIPEVPVLYLWGALFIITAVYLGATQALPDGVSGWRYLWKGVGVFLLVWGVLALLGGMAGHRDILRPVPFALTDGGLAAMSGSAATPELSEHLFTRVASVQELDAQLSQAKAHGKPVLLDYYADWCIDCIRMEKGTFSHPKVNEVLRDRFVLVQIDVTDPNDPDTRAIKRRFGVFGPPAMLFFSAEGIELEGLRRYGYMAADEFLKHIQRV